MIGENLFYKIILIAHLQIWDKLFVSNIELEEWWVDPHETTKH
jgi:hypothetical protein